MREWQFCAPILNYAGDKDAFDPPVAFDDVVEIGYASDWYRIEGMAHSPHLPQQETGLAVVGCYMGPDSLFDSLIAEGVRDRDLTERCASVPIAIWCVRPTALAIDQVIHRRTPPQGESAAEMAWDGVGSFRCLPQYFRESVTRSDLHEAAEIFRALVTVPKHGAVWAALRIITKALTESMWDVRIVLLWVALEALFGVDEKSEMRFRLSTNLALYLADTPDERRAIAKTARDLYDVRSKVVHGSRATGIKPEQLLADCERIEVLVRRSLKRILLGDVARFDSTNRVELFSELLFGPKAP